MTIENAAHTWTFTGSSITSGSETELQLDYMSAKREDGETGFNPESDGPLTITYKGSSISATFKQGR